MAKRSSAAKATRGVSKGRKPISSGSSNPKINKFRSQYNNLNAIAKGKPSKKIHNNKKALEAIAKDASEGRRTLEQFEDVNMLGQPNESKKKSKVKKDRTQDDGLSDQTAFTTASFASVFSNCTNNSLNDFFNVWNPNLETHKDALAVIAGLSQSIDDQSDTEYAQVLFKILSNSETPINVTIGALLALTFVIRNLSADTVNEKFDTFYPVLKTLVEKHHESRKKTLVKCLIRCFASMSKVHKLGKEAIESGTRKKINRAIRRLKLQDKIRL